MDEDMAFKEGSSDQSIWEMFEKSYSPNIHQKKKNNAGKTVFSPFFCSGQEVISLNS